MGVGWDLALKGLGVHLETGAAADPKTAETWPASENGKAFIRGSSDDDWRRAAVAAGDDEAAATAAAQNTAAFYVGQPPAGG